MSTFDVPGAQLYYETHGHGPLIVLIPGAPGNARVFTALSLFHLLGKGVWPGGLAAEMSEAPGRRVIV